MQNIMKFVNSSTKQTMYVLYPENIYEIHDTAEGCWIGYSDDGEAYIDGFTARQVKRSIQEKLDQPLRYLKTEFTYAGHKGTRYFNVAKISAVISHGVVDRNNEKIEVCSIRLHSTPHEYKVDHPAHEVAYQIRRVMDKLDQDEEICCSPETETE